VKRSEYKSGKKLAFVLMIAFVFFDFTALARAGVNLGGIAFIAEAAEGKATQAEGAQIDRFEATTVGFNRVMQCFVAMLFIIWMRRMHKNLWGLGARGVGSPSSSCLYSWAIPLVAFVWPFLIMNEIWKASDPDFTEKKTWRRAPMSVVMIFWWISWIVFSLLGVAANFIAKAIELGKSSDLQFIGSFYFMSLIAQLAALGASVFAILVVLKLTHRQEQKREIVLAMNPRQDEVEDDDDDDDAAEVLIQPLPRPEIEPEVERTIDVPPESPQAQFLPEENEDYPAPGPITRFEEQRRLEKIERQKERPGDHQQSS